MAEYINGRHAVDFLEHVKLSAHALIEPSGVVIRCRDDDQRAWHARGFNHTHLGVEVLVPGEHTYASFVRAIDQPGWANDAQMVALRELCGVWCERWGLEADDIKGHCDVDPGRKVDPGRGFQLLKVRYPNHQKTLLHD